jgi:hypothetical protein
MTKEELKEYLKENLSIYINKNFHSSQYGSKPYTEITIDLYIEGEIFTGGTLYLDD